MVKEADEPKQLIWRGASKADFMAFPRTVQREMGYALFLAQVGERHSTMAKTLGGFGGAAVIEVRKATTATPIGRFIPCATPMQFMCFTHSRRNRRRASRHPRQSSI